MAAIPVGLAEYDLATKTKKVFPLYADGSGEDTAQANFCTTRSYNPISRTISGVEYQVASIYDDPSEYVVIGVRNNGGSGPIDENDAWTTYVMDGTGGRPTMQRNAVDNHNTIALGIDSDGYLHICWGMHNDALLYKRSAAALASWTGTMSSNLAINAALTSVTYPHFATDPTGKLYFMCRGTGGSGNGNSFIYSYTTATTTWASLAGLTDGLLIDGEGSTGAESAYPFKLAFTSDFDGAGAGHLIIAWVWDDGSARHDIPMVKWNGTNWLTWAGAAQTVPITTSNDNVIDPVATTLELRGEEVLLLDSSNRPHLIYKHYVSASTTKDALWHNYWNGSAWVKTRLDWGLDNDYDWAAEDAFIDGDDVIHCIITNKGQGDGIYIFTSPGTDWNKTWKLSEFTDQSVVIGTDVAQTRALIQFDPYQASTHGRLQFLVPLAGASGGTNTAFPDGWDYADKATITNPSSDVDDPFFIIDLSTMTARFWAEVQADLGDVRLSDGTGNMLPCYVHVYDYGAETGMLFGRWTGPLGSAATQEVWIHYGNATAATVDAVHILGKNNSWRNELVGFYIDGDGTDFTRVGNNLTAASAPTENQPGPFGTLLSTEFDGTDDYYSLTPFNGFGSGAVPTGAIVLWYNADEDTETQTLAGMTDTADTDRYLVGQIRGATAGDPLTAAINANGAAQVFADSATGFSINTWQHAGFRFATTASRQAVLNGAGGTAETSTRAADAIDCFTIGSLRRTTVSGYFDGNLSLVQCYALAYCPSVAEIAHQYAMADQATFWGTWEDATPAETSGSQQGPQRLGLRLGVGF